MRRGHLPVLLLLATSAAAIAAPSPAHAENFSGRWLLTFYGKCVVTRANEAACATLQSPATFPITAIPGAVLVVTGKGDYRSNAAGRYTVRFTTVITERVPGRHAPRHCTNTLVFSGTYSGTCTEVGSGHGHIAPGGTGMPDFWQDDTAGVWKGRPAVAFADSSPTDTLNPACPGTLDTRQFMALLGVHHVPSGITAKLVLTHRR